MSVQLESFEKHIFDADDEQFQTSLFLPKNNKEQQMVNNIKDPKDFLKRHFLNGTTIQWLITTIVIVIYIGCGMPTGYSALLLPQLQTPNSTLQITENEGSWIASIHAGATPLGGLISGMMMDGRFGRKWSLIICFAPIIIGWLLIGLAHNYIMILVGRLIAGVAVGSVGAPSQIMISEISEPHLRGILSTVPFAGHAFGILIMYMIGSYFQWQETALLAIIVPAVGLLVFLSVPDTPIWLIRNGRVKEAMKYLCWLRGDDIQAQKEFDHLVSRINMEKMDGTSDSTREGNLWYQALLKPQVLKPFSIICVFGVGQSLSGYYTIIFYAVDVIEEMGVRVDKEVTAIVTLMTALIRLIFVILSLFLIARIGRRPLALLSTILGGVCSLALGVLLILRQSFNVSFSYDLYVIVALLLVYIAGTTVGIMPLFTILIGELSPAKWRGFISGLSFGVSNTVLFIFTKAFPWMKNTMSISGLFLLFGIYCLLSGLHVYLFLPETKNKPLSEIEDYFAENRYLWIRRKRS